MAARLVHRGPDGSGLYLDRMAGLAHTRLAIIDPERGAQPIFNEDGSIGVVFNGEIFNYRELTAELLALGHVFRTASDTEVLVHGYEVWGEQFVEHLNGQFAIALWDGRRERLVLARDRAGIRPLFHTEQAGRLLFASEIKALFALPGVPRALDSRALAAISTAWSVPPPLSAFEGVQTLHPGELAVFDARGGRRTRRYWDWNFTPRHAEAFDEDEGVERLRDALRAAVRLQMRADVPVGAYLSGGLDSAIVAALARREAGARLRTFSLTFEDPAFDESPHQQRMQRWLETEHTAIRITRSDIGRAFVRAIAHTESPVVRTAPVPLMLLAAHVRNAGYKAVLTGEGADEVFAGYDLFKEAALRRFMARDADSLARPRLFERLYGYLEHAPGRTGHLGIAFFRDTPGSAACGGLGHLPRWASTARTQRFFSAELRARLDQFDGAKAWLAELPAAHTAWPPASQDQYLEAHSLLAGYLLSSQGDRMAMAHSVETRLPFLDHTLIEFANGLPPTAKRRALREKRILKLAARPWLPPEIVERVKQPYRAPDSASFFERDQPLDYVRELLSPRSLSEAGWFEPSLTARLLEKCRSGRAIGFADNMAFVFILSTMLLHRIFVCNERLCEP